MSKPLMQTKLIDGAEFRPSDHEAKCARCADRFVEGQPVYRIDEAAGAHCASCIVELQAETELWQERMAEFALMEEHGLLDRDMLAPSAPMYSMPF